MGGGSGGRVGRRRLLRVGSAVDLGEVEMNDLMELCGERNLPGISPISRISPRLSLYLRV